MTRDPVIVSPAFPKRLCNGEADIDLHQGGA